MAKARKTPQNKHGGAPLASSPELLDAWRRYEAGDVVAARRAAAALLASGSLSAQDLASAEDLLSRTRFPTWSLAFAGGALAIIALLILLAVTRS